MKCIGIYGATGSFDFGDYAMLVDNIEQIYNLNSEISFIVFSPNPKVTKICLEKNVPKKIMKKIDIVEDFIEKKSNSFSIKKTRFCSQLTYNLIKYDYEYEKYVDIWNETKKGQLDILSDKLISNLEKIDTMIFNGGGYLQNGWKNRNIQFMIFINALHWLRKKIYFMACSVGPLDARYEKYVKTSLELVEKIVIRDGKNYSFKFLNSPILRDKMYIRTDDLMLIQDQYEKSEVKPYVIIEIMFFINKCTKGRRYIINEIGDFIKYIINQDKNVYLLNLDKSDFIAQYYIKTICKKINSPNLKCPIPLNDCIKVNKLYELYANAELSISMKYHPAVFSLRNNVPCIGIICDSDGYYKGKFFGAYDSLGCNGNENIIYLNDLSAELLIEKYNNREQLRANTLKIDKFRNDRKEYLMEILNQIH